MLETEVSVHLTWPQVVKGPKKMVERKPVEEAEAVGAQLQVMPALQLGWLLV